MKTPVVTYCVRGKWQFPLDMLRYDESSAATPEDQALIDKLSAENCPESIDIQRTYEVWLKASPRATRTWMPTTDRWKSFRWYVGRIDFA